MDNCDFDPALSRAIAYEQLQANLRAREEAATVRPFRFEDLNGKPEPESWGPCYPKTASAAVEKWRRLARVRELTTDEKREYGAAVGTWIRGLNNPAQKRWRVPATDLHYHKHFTCESIRGKLRAKFAAAANAERLSWALGGARPSLKGSTNDIKRDYAAAMREKRARLKFLADVDAFNAAQPVLLAA